MLFKIEYVMSDLNYGRDKLFCSHYCPSRETRTKRLIAIDAIMRCRAKRLDGLLGVLLPYVREDDRTASDVKPEVTHGSRGSAGVRAYLQSLKDKNNDNNNNLKSASSIKSHVSFYGCPNNMSYLWNLGFMLCVLLVLQVLSGLLLAFHYTCDVNVSYYSVIHIVRDVYYGWCFRYLHSVGASLVLGAMYFHMIRGIYVVCYQYNSNLWLSGVVLFLLVMAISFLGYVLTWGHMSFWGGTVISNLLCCVPCCVYVMLGGLYVCNASLRRFFVFHVAISICVLLFVVVHICYVHYVSSSNPMCIVYNNVCHCFRLLYVRTCLFYSYLLF